MKYYKSLMWTVGLAFFCYSCNSQSKRERQPNVVLIMADDMGFGDLGRYGSMNINTPHIDALAQGGIRLTDYHSNGAVCSPTRASLLTGLYPQEAGIEGVVTAKNHRKTGMDVKNFTLAELFKDNGYKTALFGKWHLGYEPEYGPNAQGFDDFRGFVSGNIDYQSHIDQEGYEDWWEDKELKPEKGYLTDLITDHGIRFMEKVKDKPFFLYLPHGTPHSPYQGPNDPAERTVNGNFKIQGSRKDVDNAYREMIESLDNNVGRIMAYLKENDLLENTLVIFCSDNGASPVAGSNAPFRGSKGQLYEGGHRVPAIFNWEGTIQPGISDELVLSMDMFSTIADLTDVTSRNNSKLSGQSMAFLFNGGKKNSIPEERIVFWRFNDQKAARKGKWKLLIQNGDSFLFDLEKDKQESVDLKEEYSDKYQELREAIKDWESNLKEDIRA